MSSSVLTTIRSIVIMNEKVKIEKNRISDGNMKLKNEKKNKTLPQ